MLIDRANHQCQVINNEPLVIHTNPDLLIIFKIKKAFELPTKGEMITLHVDGPTFLIECVKEQVTNNAIYESYLM